MAAGPLARILAQLAITFGGAALRAARNAYKEAAVRGAAESGSRASSRQGMMAALAQARRMNADYAKKILDVEIPEKLEKLTPEARKEVMSKVAERAAQLRECSAPKENSPGSPYLQKKVDSAAEVLRDHLKALERAAEAKGKKGD